ncbi:PDZ domain-containing protein [Bacillus sp. FJAT-42376]|uniref:PDZ domain-containing protein n=1 Tax=Bacillus sp. FJAT-42376 TaxID=2014076 RepID=UPI000F509814|nr:PDZ domain-containing protein [Bacillus sp. FJAT-42376]AZB44490.1 PDZ domain-containing protein [Bacillus sp. FJAT-42376]
MAWILELLGGVLRFFQHPLTYYFVLYTLLIGFFRIKQERNSFYTKVEVIYEELIFTYTKGLFAGLMVSAAVILTGLSLPAGIIILIGAATALLSFFFRPQWLSAAFIMGLAFASAVFLMTFSKGSLPAFMKDIVQMDPAVFAILTGMLLIAEGWLVYRTGHLRTSPSILKSSRGLPIGNHTAKRHWLLPLILFVPGGTLTSVFSWWPVFEMNGQSFSLFILPFFIGFHQEVRGSLPKESIQVTSKRILWLGMVTLLIACGSLWWLPLAFAAMILAIAGRIFLIIRQKMNDRSAAYFFSKKDKGLMILGILPKSPAEKIGLKVGETITKVNGSFVKTTGEFYEALQKNRALCKLEIIGLNGEIRYAQRATYEGEHHELGLLFVEQQKKSGSQAV